MKLSNIGQIKTDGGNYLVLQDYGPGEGISVAHQCRTVPEAIGKLADTSTSHVALVELLEFHVLAPLSGSTTPPDEINKAVNRAELRIEEAKRHILVLQALCTHSFIDDHCRTCGKLA